MQQLEKMETIGWIDHLSNIQLQDTCAEFGLQAAETTEGLREALTRFAATETHPSSVFKRLEQLEALHGKINSISKGSVNIEQGLLYPTGVTQSCVTTTAPPSMPGFTMIDKVSNYPIKFPFSEQVSDLFDVYYLEVNALPKTIPKLLKYKPPALFSSNSRKGKEWRLFIGTLRPSESSDDDSRSEKQKQRQRFASYANYIHHFIGHVCYTLAQYTFHIQRKEFSYLNKTTLLAKRLFDCLQKNSVETPKKPDRGHSFGQVLGEKIEVHRACRRCGQKGYYNANCTKPGIFFCWSCGQKETGIIEAVQSSINLYTDRLCVTVCIDEIWVEATIDTAATRSFISESFAEEIWTPDIIKKTSTSVRLADGSTIGINKSLEVPVELGNADCTVELLVMPNGVDKVILGLDFLRKIRTKISIGGLPVNFKETESYTSKRRKYNDETRIHKN